MRELLWSTFLPWVRVPGTTTYRSVAAPPDLPGYRPYDAGHEVPGATVDDPRARRVACWILTAEPARVVEVTALLDRLGLGHGPDEDSWRRLGAWLARRAPDEATPSLVLDVGLLLGRRIVDDLGGGARWEHDSENVQAYPYVLAGSTVVALPLQAAEAGADLGAVLSTARALAAEATDPDAGFVGYLRGVLDDLDASGAALTAEDLRWMLSAGDRDTLPALPDDLERRLAAHLDPDEADLR